MTTGNSVRMAAMQRRADERLELVVALTNVRSLLRDLQPALNVMAREVLDDIIADNIEPVLAKIGASQ